MSETEADAARAALDRLDRLVPTLAAALDDETGFPAGAIDRLRTAGALSLPLPREAGGLDFGCRRQGRPAARFLRLLGRAGIALGRLLEAHVNALRLIELHAAPSDAARHFAAARAGRLFALWVTDGERPLEIRDGRLVGDKAFCSGAGHADAALVTARTPDGETRMFVTDVRSVRLGRPRALAGVRAAVTADTDLDLLPAGDPIGGAGDYLRQPEFSAGAWRGSAVACGALEALVEGTIAALVARGRHLDPHQAGRIGELLIARDTAALWVDRAADAADAAGTDDPGRVAATVNLARIAVEGACLGAIPIVQRALGLSAFAAGSRIERLQRDLATYLRQPAPDETLREAALWFAAAPTTAAADVGRAP